MRRSRRPRLGRGRTAAALRPQARRDASGRGRSMESTARECERVGRSDGARLRAEIAALRPFLGEHWRQCAQISLIWSRRRRLSTASSPCGSSCLPARTRPEQDFRRTGARRGCKLESCNDRCRGAITYLNGAEDFARRPLTSCRMPEPCLPIHSPRWGLGERRPRRTHVGMFIGVAPTLLIVTSPRISRGWQGRGPLEPGHPALGEMAAGSSRDRC